MNDSHVELPDDDGRERVAAAFEKLDEVIARAQRLVLRGTTLGYDETSARADVE